MAGLGLTLILTNDIRMANKSTTKSNVISNNIIHVVATHLYTVLGWIQVDLGMGVWTSSFIRLKLE